eukprot:g11247.t1
MAGLALGLDDEDDGTAPPFGFHEGGAAVEGRSPAASGPEPVARTGVTGAEDIVANTRATAVDDENLSSTKGEEDASSRFLNKNRRLDTDNSYSGLTPAPTLGPTPSPTAAPVGLTPAPTLGPTPSPTAASVECIDEDCPGYRDGWCNEGVPLSQP